jgi:hypothetical protein
MLDWMDTCAWIDTPTKHGVLFLGQLVDTIEGYPYPNGETKTHLWYGQNPCCHGQDGRPVYMATGPGAGTIVNYAWIYDPVDLGRVASGELQPWQVVPPSVFKAHTMGNFTRERRHRLYAFGGMWYDEMSNLLFVVECDREKPPASMEWQPVIHVFGIQP